MHELMYDYMICHLNEYQTGVESEMALTNRWFAIAVITATVLKQPGWELQQSVF